MLELEFWSASWCTNCKPMKPIINELEAAGYPVHRMDADDNVSLAIQNNIRGVPTILFKKNGEEVGRLVGAKDKRTVLAQIQKYS